MEAAVSDESSGTDSSAARCAGRSGFPRRRPSLGGSVEKIANFRQQLLKSQSIDSTTHRSPRRTRPRARGPPRWAACVDRLHLRILRSQLLITSRVASVLLSSTGLFRAGTLRKALEVRSREDRCSSLVVTGDHHGDRMTQRFVLGRAIPETRHVPRRFWAWIRIAPARVRTRGIFSNRMERFRSTTPSTEVNGQ